MTIHKKSNREIWENYFKDETKQKISSKKTARIQKPRTLKMIENFKIKLDNKVIFDIGCGIGSELFKEELKKINKSINYFGCDPFNKSKKENLFAINHCANGKSDIVTLNNVLNTIPDREIWINILEQAKNSLKEKEGVLMVIVYEGEKNSFEKKEELKNGVKIEMSPIQTRDGWQNRKKTSHYLEAVNSVFPNVSLVSTSSGKLIIASKNTDLKLNNIMKNNKKLLKR